MNTLAPATMPRIATIDERYQSYNVEMLEVTGGKFWKPYGPELNALLKQPAPGAASSSSGDTPAGMNPGLYQYRPPIDLSNARLRKLAAALGPAYVRVSGTWANSTYFPDTDTAPAEPPAGFIGVLKRDQWKGVVDFSRAVDAGIVTSFATSVGARDNTGVWAPEQAKRFLDYTRSVGGQIAAAEFMNEPTFAAMGGAPAGYDAAAYGRDFKVFRTFAKEAVPNMLITGPGSVGETTGDWGLAYGNVQMLKTRDLLAASGPGVDAFSYHHYGASSQRCSAADMPGTTVEDALSEQWLRRTDETLAFYRPLRGFMPSEIDFCPVELPGRAARLAEAPLTAMDALMEQLADALEPLMGVPFGFFGHSVGSCMAYEAARQLRSIDQRSSVHLFVSGRGSPDVAAADHH